MTSLATVDRRTLLKALALAPTLAVSIPRTVRAQAQAAGLISSDVCMVMPERNHSVGTACLSLGL